MLWSAGLLMVTLSVVPMDVCGPAREKPAVCRSVNLLWEGIRSLAWWWEWMGLRNAVPCCWGCVVRTSASLPSPLFIFTLEELVVQVGQ